MAVYQWRQLAQLMPQSTSIETLYEAPAGYTAVAKTLWVSNVGSGTRQYSIYHNDDGSLVTSENAIARNLSLNTARYDLWEAQGVLMAASNGGKISVAISEPEDFTFTLYGAVLAAQSAPKMLFQVCPPTTSMTRIPSPPNGKTWLVKSLWTANVTSPTTPVVWDLYHSRAVESATKANKVIPFESVNQDYTGLIEAQGILMAAEYYDYIHTNISKPAGITFTAYGEEFDA